jgi:hypothetical protein
LILENPRSFLPLSAKKSLSGFDLVQTPIKIILIDYYPLSISKRVGESDLQADHQIEEIKLD